MYLCVCMWVCVSSKRASELHVVCYIESAVYTCRCFCVQTMSVPRAFTSTDHLCHVWLVFTRHSFWTMLAWYKADICELLHHCVFLCAGVSRSCWPQTERSLTPSIRKHSRFFVSQCLRYGLLIWCFKVMYHCNITWKGMFHC